jgi:hypothetical protein
MYSEKDLSHWHFVLQKCHRDRPENEPRYKGSQAGGHKLETWHDRQLFVTEHCLTTCLPSYTMTERAVQLHHDNAPVHSTALVQAFLPKHHITQVCQPPYSPVFRSLRLLTLPKAKIAVEREEICKCDSHTVHKLT